MRCLYIALLIAAAALVADRASAVGQADLKVDRVAIFSSGVAFYECEAQVEGVASAELSFRTEQINDIIKSLVVRDLDGGSIGVVSYASSDPIEKTLRSFGVDITGKPTLAKLLDQLRGEPVEITGTRELKGVIFGVERQTLQVGDGGVIEIDVLNVLTEGGLQQLRIRDLEGVKLTNEKIDAELRQALITLASGHDADKKSVVLNFNGEGKRRVRVAYLLEAPIWKTTYRLVLDEEGAPFLQGWATVENATEEDWRDVQLSLISGRPISFTMDLYTPIYIPRPREELELYASLRPPEYAGAVDMEADEKRRGMNVFGGGAARGGRGGGRVARSARAMPSDVMEQLSTLGYNRTSGGQDDDDSSARRFNAITLEESGVESVASAADAGELFEYSIRAPVTIPRQHSAMLPIVNQKIRGEKVSIFNPATHAKHPLNGLKIKNVTGLNLMQGPVTLFDGDVYAGDAKLPDLKPDEERLIAYALDLGTEVVVKQQPRPDEITSLRIVRGAIIAQHKYVDEREYVVKNKNNRMRPVIIEQPCSSAWKLIEPEKPYEEAANLKRFLLEIPAGETKNLNVKLERLLDETIALGNRSADQIKFYLKSRVISTAVKQALENVIQLQGELLHARNKREQAERDVSTEISEQARIRDNLRTLDRNTDAYRRQLQKFDEIETTIEKLRAQIVSFRAEEDRKQKALDDYLLSLNVE